MSKKEMFIWCGLGASYAFGAFNLFAMFMLGL
jgi:hypothetical protein